MVTNLHQAQDKGEISFWKPSVLFLIFFAGFVFYLWVGFLGVGLGPLVYYLFLVLLYVLVRPLAPKNLIVLPIIFGVLFTLHPKYIGLDISGLLYGSDLYIALSIGEYQIQYDENNRIFTYGKSPGKYIDLNPMTNTRSLWLGLIESFVFFSGIMLIVHYLIKTIRTKADP